MGQSSWSRNITSRVAGRQADMWTQEHAIVKTGRNELSTAIKPGYFIAQGATDDDVMINDTGATGADYIGLAVDNENRERAVGYTYTDGYAQNDLVPYAKTGVWYVNCGSTATKGGQVYVRFVAGTTSVIGEAYSSADTASCDAINAKFAETITAAGLVAVELNLTQVD